jgi:phage terminase large subunit-like protein
MEYKNPSDRVFRFFSLLKHAKGKWAGVPFNLIPWQIEQVIKPVFDTLRPDGLRQYRTVYIEIPKKNGKTELGSGLALYGLCADGEHGAEIYSAAGDKEQASLVYYPAEYMVKSNPQLKSRLKVLSSRKRIVYEKTSSFYQVLSAEAFTKHGINPHIVIFDELHAQPNRELWDVLVEGTDTAREQQLIIVLTTAGIYDKNSIGWEQHNYAHQVSKGIIQDDTFLPVLYCLDDEKNEDGQVIEDWEDPEVWKRLNPSLGSIFDLKKIEDHYKQVVNNPLRLNNFLRYRLNKWVNQISQYIPMNVWDTLHEKIDEGNLLKRPCFGAIDLSKSIDLSCFCLLFPPRNDKEKWIVKCNFYCPENAIMKRSKEDKVPYDYWRQAGFITATPGDVIDKNFIKHDVLKAANLYRLHEVAFDPWGAIQLAAELSDEEGINMVEHRQGYKSMSPPTKEALNLTLSRKINHLNNPVLRWCVNNVSVKVDPAENVKPDKEKSRERIDGFVAFVMALGRALVNTEKQSVYKQRGVLFI